MFKRELIGCLAILFVCSSAGVAGERMPDAYDTPAVAPALQLEDLQGQSHRLADYRGKVVLVNFWASWCGPCVTELPGMQRLQRRMEEAGKPFTILAVDVDEPRHRVIKFIKMLRLGLTVLLDNDGMAAKAWDVRVYPTSFLLDRHGSIRYRVIGPLVWDGDEAIDTIDRLIEEGSGNDAPPPNVKLRPADPATAPD